MVASDGGVFSFGDATFYGSTGAIHLNQPIVGMAPTASGHGYWFVAADGGVFAFGDAGFFGSAGAMTLDRAHRRHGRNRAGSGRDEARVHARSRVIRPAAWPSRTQPVVTVERLGRRARHARHEHGHRRSLTDCRPAPRSACDANSKAAVARRRDLLGLRHRRGRHLHVDRHRRHARPRR